MKINFLLKHLKIMVFVLALSFSASSNASSTTNLNVPLASNSISINQTTTASALPLTGSWLRAFLNWLASNGCSICHSNGCSHGGGGTPPGGGGSGTSIPLDGGLSILALGAAAFGIRKLRGKKIEEN